ncbi:hypothetical protein COLO4_25490 [Corchorus olitorius]|uniref:Uncharacterized protein n=1 Tax=Corchorus olitorius TaxID=93759 RepID=A0A1R3I252_9ROSI|nr:hypothetical protein COLO4_25490 [Corchorus olitorius]
MAGRVGGKVWGRRVGAALDPRQLQTRVES